MPDQRNLFSESFFVKSKKMFHECPPCFNCLLPTFKCLNYANCSSFSGRCDCRSGFSGDDCSVPGMASLPAKPESAEAEATHTGRSEQIPSASVLRAGTE